MVACYPDSHHVEITIELEGHAIAADVVLLPYDLEGLSDSLAEAAARPRPYDPYLVSLLLEYEAPTLDDIDRATAEWSNLRDSVAAVARRLRSMDPTQPGYRDEYRGFREAYAEVIRTSGNRDRAIRGLLGSGDSLASLAAAAADSLRAWEAEVFAPLAVLAPQAAGGRRPIEAEHSEGFYRAEVQPGHWWVWAKARHPRNPFAEYFWYQEVVIPRYSRVTRVPLNDQLLELRWRH